METPRTYLDNFYSYHFDGSLRSAQTLIPRVLHFCQPNSVLDVGCGVGTWLSVWTKMGVSDIQGLDGPYIKPDQLSIPVENFREVDLNEGFKLSTKFDLVSCLEVAEHIRKESARTLIDSLCNASDVILFSAAVPGQEGTLHINEQFPDYWIKLFEEKDFVPVDCLRQEIWNEKAISWWYRQNVMFFVKRSALDNYPVLNIFFKTQKDVLSLIHPELFLHKAKKADGYEKALKTPFHVILFFLRRWFVFLRNKLNR